MFHPVLVVFVTSFETTSFVLLVLYIRVADALGCYSAVCSIGNGPPVISRDDFVLSIIKLTPKKKRLIFVNVFFLFFFSFFYLALNIHVVVY